MAGPFIPSTTGAFTPANSKTSACRTATKASSERPDAHALVTSLAPLSTRSACRRNLRIVIGSPFFSKIHARTTAHTSLMCPPDFYGIEYEINPWMSRQRQADQMLAIEQWEGLVADP